MYPRSRSRSNGGAPPERAASPAPPARQDRERFEDADAGAAASRRRRRRSPGARVVEASGRGGPAPSPVRDGDAKAQLRGRRRRRRDEAPPPQERPASPPPPRCSSRSPSRRPPPPLSPSPRRRLAPPPRDCSRGPSPGPPPRRWSSRSRSPGPDWRRPPPRRRDDSTGRESYAERRYDDDYRGYNDYDDYGGGSRWRRQDDSPRRRYSSRSRSWHGGSYGSRGGKSYGSKGYGRDYRGGKGGKRGKGGKKGGKNYWRDVRDRSRSQQASWGRDQSWRYSDYGRGDDHDGYRKGVREPRGPKPDGCKTVWLGWMREQPQESEVSTFFADCGAVTEVRVSEAHVKGFFAHVTFEATEAVDEAVKKAGSEFKGDTVYLDYAYMDKVAGTNDGKGAHAKSRRYRPKSSKPPDGHTIWVGDVSIDASEQDLIDLFEPCGKIEMICLQENQLKNGQFGHIKFFETEAVDKAAALAGTPVKGVPLRIDFAEDKPVAAYRVNRDRAAHDHTKPEGCRTIWMGGISNETDEETVRGFFEKCGEITDLRLDHSKRTGTLFAHVEFAATENVDEAIKLSGTRLNGSRVRIDYAQNKRPHDGKGHGKGKGKDYHEAYPPHGMPPPGWPGAAPPPHYGWHPHPPPGYGPIGKGGPPPYYAPHPHHHLPPRPPPPPGGYRGSDHRGPPEYPGYGPPPGSYPHGGHPAYPDRGPPRDWGPPPGHFGAPSAHPQNATADMDLPPGEFRPGMAQHDGSVYSYSYSYSVSRSPSPTARALGGPAAAGHAVPGPPVPTQNPELDAHHRAPSLGRRSDGGMHDDDASASEMEG